MAITGEAHGFHPPPSTLLWHELPGARSVNAADNLILVLAGCGACGIKCSQPLPYSARAAGLLASRHIIAPVRVPGLSDSNSITRATP
ncbi:hypothetical protein GLOTRDRAFT_128704 [Gloeophyllum trabeum ATCC 11539]|uniref:Uncharacterized protein n=1 Tax=Gloeophyllum trabeum (strain ATCC 11539 / FP-39264 / Madison 617) TaxID=670483 RepID=S7QBN2_GLOTA|nr:uncharacterized protein GLOTRDRAFT_128704 [Gloeophyllum trabeum ATCC 11539]EPQ56768.1 hypothetical protein GLOTRDRAFT_128704 [Gloeophyllum trabeum ATCC 11539]